MNARDPLFWRRAAAIRAKEWAQVWLDPSTFGLVVLMPLILMFLFGSAVTLDVRATRTGLIDLDLFGAPAPLRIRDGADWQSGTFSITHPDGALAVDLQGLAVPDGHSVDVRLSAAAQPD